MSVKLVITGQAMHYNQHYLLDGLDVANQHPIEAITGLRDELSRRYILPIGGIPASDLAETYISVSILNQTEAALQSLFNRCQADIQINAGNITTNTSNILTNTNDIFNLTTLLDGLKNQVNNLPGADQTTFNNAVCIKQGVFEATDTIKSFDIVIVDTDLKVLEPTVLNSSGSRVNDEDYTITYPNDTTLRITFINNGVYKVNYLSGEISDSEFNILLEYYKKLENKVSMNTNGSILKPAHDIVLTYDTDGKVIKETYTGNVNKVIDYIYDTNKNIIKKTVTQDNIIKTANYQYDSNNKLISIQDDGTDIPIDGAKARAYSCTLGYDTGIMIKETYTGDINKVITYEHNTYGDVIKKTIVEDGITKTATYIYDDKRKLIGIQDDGTESYAVVFPDNTSGGTGTGTTTDIGIITNAEIDLIFETIFID